MMRTKGAFVSLTPFSLGERAGDESLLGTATRTCALTLTLSHRESEQLEARLFDDD